MTTTTARLRFSEALYAEHSEDAAFLYEQNLDLLGTPGLSWDDAESVQGRLAAHLDALVAGGAPARLACETFAATPAEVDVGEVYVAVSLLCRSGARQALERLLETLGVDEADKLAAAAQALKLYWPAEWSDGLERLCAAQPAMVGVFAKVFGSRRIRDARIARWFVEASNRDLSVLLDALGRTGGADHVGMLAARTRHDNPEVAVAAARAAVRLGDAATVEAAYAAAGEPWAVLALLLGGDRRASEILQGWVGSGAHAHEMLIALGLLGDLSATRTLYDCLSLEGCADAAALALTILTGATLYEEVFVPDVIDPDALFDDERERFEATGQLPTRADGEAYGETQQRIVTEPKTWRAWLSDNKGRFDPAVRYRLGEPYSPASLLRSLQSPWLPAPIRRTVCDEYQSRYGRDFPLETDMPVVQQRKLLERMAEWVRINASNFAPGDWYFQGDRQA